MNITSSLKMMIFALSVSAACTKTINECDIDADCKDIAYPFCDVNGQYQPSGGTNNVCTITPPDCPAERCGCSPGAATCTSDQLSTCNPDRQTVTTTSCALGCANDGSRCLDFEPSNGLGVAVAASSAAAAVTIPDGSFIDTDSGAVTDIGGVPIPLSSVVISQTNGPDIRAFYASSLNVGNIRVFGARALALVSSGVVAIRGKLNANASGPQPGPGATRKVPCAGASGGGGGGGGNATAGGTGEIYSVQNGDSLSAGGLLQSSYSPLTGGCGGGNATGGGGGGGVQIISMTSVTVDAAEINLGGGGGASSSGGGAGGNLIVEAPTVSLSGVVAANGGGGGGCSKAGQDAGIDNIPAGGGTGATQACFSRGGSGATRSSGPGDGTSSGDGGGGGGAVGRMLVRSRDGKYDSTGLTTNIVVELQKLLVR